MLKCTWKAALVALSVVTGSASAGPISQIGGYWSIQFADADVLCGTNCSTDQYQYAYFERFDLVGADGFSHSAQSGGALASYSAFGLGTTFEDDSTFEYNLNISRFVFAAVEEDAHASARAEGRIALSGRFGFSLTEESIYTGDTFGSIQNGMILGPGNYEAFFGTALSTGFGLSTGVMRAGQQNSAFDMPSFTFRVQSVAVPEPATLALLGLGLLGLGAARRRRSA